MRDYINSLPESQVTAVFFNETKSSIDIEKLSVLSLPQGEYLINVGPKGPWSSVYVCKTKDMKDLVVRQRQESLEISTTTHLMVSLQTVKADILLSTNMTTYEKISDSLFSVEYSPNFNILLKTEFNESGSLVHNKYVLNWTLQRAYQNDPHWVEVIREIHKIHHRDIQQKSLGDDITVINKESESVVTEDIIRFVYDNVIKDVIDHYAGDLSYVEAKLFYDKVDGKDFVICYDIPEVGHRRLYYLDIQKTIKVYKSMMSKNKSSLVVKKFKSLSQLHIEALATF
jgi:hypothetical protein